MRRSWIAVASRAHVRQGLAGGFMQVCHGKAAPLRRMCAGDAVAYYSPTDVLGDRKPVQAFTALGVLCAAQPYEVDMGHGFVPWRRDVDWADAREALIGPLLPELDFSRGRRNWGYAMRFGYFEISAHDLGVIAAAMGLGSSAIAAA